MSSGSWLRFVVGILLSIDVLRVALVRPTEMSTILLSIVFLALVGLYLVKRV